MIFKLHIDVQCFAAGDPLSVLSSSSNQTTVEREVVRFSCTFKGNYSLVNYDGVYWMITFQNGSSIIVYNNISDYHFDIQQNSLCRFTTKLYMNTSMSLDKAMVTCTAIMDSMLGSSNATSYLSKLFIIVKYTHRHIHMYVYVYVCYIIIMHRCMHASVLGLVIKGQVIP